MTKSLTLIDYGVGNLLSVSRAFASLGAEVQIVDRPADLPQSGRYILPGVGAFGKAMAELDERGFTGPIKEIAQRGDPLLGICLGMQLLFDRSMEFGAHEGLGLIPGTVEKIADTGDDGIPHKIPHIGWNGLRRPGTSRSWEGTILNGLNDGAEVYFVHSYTTVPTNEGDRLADAYYDGRLISAAVQVANVIGCQFHPEKSGKVGLALLHNFLKLGPGSAESRIT